MQMCESCKSFRKLCKGLKGNKTEIYNMLRLAVLKRDQMKSTDTSIDKKGKVQEVKGNSDKATTEIKQGCRNIFVDELKEIYFAEKALMISIPIMIKKAATKELVTALTIHYNFTKEHIKRLEDIFTSIGESEIVTKYEAMYGASKSLK